MSAAEWNGATHLSDKNCLFPLYSFYNDEYFPAYSLQVLSILVEGVIHKPFGRENGEGIF